MSTKKYSIPMHLLKIIQLTKPFICDYVMKGVGWEINGVFLLVRGDKNISVDLFLFIV